MSTDAKSFLFLLFPFPASALSGAAAARLGIGALSLNRVDSGKIRCMKNWREGTKVHMVGPLLTTST
jgi:hypothetical protein